MVAFVPAALPLTSGSGRTSGRAFVARRPAGLAPARGRAVRTPVATATAEPTKNSSVAGRGGKTDSDATTDDPAPLNAAAPLTDSKFYQKYDSYRGKEVPTVSETMTKFNDLFPRPVPSVYRNIISEILMTTHLAKHCAMWKYVDALAALLALAHALVVGPIFGVFPDDTLDVQPLFCLYSLPLFRFPLLPRWRPLARSRSSRVMDTDFSRLWLGHMSNISALTPPTFFSFFFCEWYGCQQLRCHLCLRL